MKPIRSSLDFKVWLHLIIFSIIILVFLWLFQVVSLKAYYELSTKTEISNIIEKVQKYYKSDNYSSYFNKLSYDTSMCIELYDGLTRTYYSYSCSASSIELSGEKRDFILKGYSSHGYKIEDKTLGSKKLLYGVTLDEDKYAFVQASIVPVDSTVNILKSQLLIVSIVVCILSLVVAIFISKKISKPIKEVTENAKLLSKGNYNVKFDEDNSIKEISELNKTLNYTTSELEKTEKLQRELLSNVTHDLKTPLTMIKAYAEMIRDLTYKNKKKRNENLNVIINEADRLNVLVNDVLDLSKYKANTIKLEYSTFDIDSLIKDIIARYDIYKVRDGYDINYEGKACLVYADRKRIEQVLYNLINNALNYTGDDKKIYIKLIDNKEDDVVRVEVTDTGKGIKDEDLPLIWDKYYKVDKTYSRMQIGTGIGLSIVKNILKLHNVNFGVNSILKKGTTFYFELKKRDNAN